MAERAAGTKPQTATERAERALAAAAIAKIQRNQTPSAPERSALKRLEKAQEEDRRWEYLHTTPKRTYMEISGRSARVLIDQAERYGLPYPRGSRQPVDLEKVIRWLHDFLAKNAQRLSAPRTDDPLLAGSDSPALERYRLARAAREELELAARRGELLDVDELLTWYDSEVAAPIRRSLEALQSQYGPAAVQVVTRALNQAGSAVGKRLKNEESDKV